MTLNLNDWIYIVSVLAIGFVMSLLIKKLMTLVIKRRIRLLNADPTNFNFLKNSVVFIIMLIAVIIVLYRIPKFQDLSKALFASAGIIAATIGFASQKAFSNLISGIFILIFRPFRVNDTIEINNGQIKGTVEEITLRHTIIKNYESRRVIIPNSQISEQTIINSSLLDSRIKKHIDIGISYQSNIDLAKNIITEVITNHPLFIDIRTEEDKKENKPALPVRVISLGEYSVTIRAYPWAANNDDAFTLQCDVLEKIKHRFDKEGIEIPFPYQNIILKKIDLAEVRNESCDHLQQRHHWCH